MENREIGEVEVITVAYWYGFHLTSSPQNPKNLYNGRSSLPLNPSAENDSFLDTQQIDFKKASQKLADLQKQRNHLETCIKV